MKQRDLPEKVCPEYGRPFLWGKKWRDDREPVFYCGLRCRTCPGRRMEAG